MIRLCYQAMVVPFVSSRLESRPEPGTPGRVQRFPSEFLPGLSIRGASLAAALRSHGRGQRSDRRGEPRQPFGTGSRFVVDDIENARRPVDREHRRARGIFHMDE